MSDQKIRKVPDSIIFGIISFIFSVQKVIEYIINFGRNHNYDDDPSDGKDSAPIDLLEQTRRETAEIMQELNSMVNKKSVV